MKKIVYITSFILLFACNSEDAGDCFQTSGNLIQQEVTIEAFEKILVNRDIKLVVKQDVNYKVVIETGKNLMNDVKVKVINDQLILTDDNTCNYVRDYGIT